MLTIQAPAKLNLTLEVLGKRRDGYHEIRSVIQTINLCDDITFRSSQVVTVKSDMPEWAPEKSLVMKAVSLLRETTGCPEGAAIEISKRIPLVAGLGGESSDAAAVLRGLNELWALGLPHAALLELAAEVSSDVAFFLHGGTALVKGKGAVREEVMSKVPFLLEQGGYFPSVDHLVPPDVTFENFCYYINLMREVAGLEKLSFY